MEMKNRSFLKLLDYTSAEIGQLLELAADLKAKKKAGIRHDQLRGKNIALIFEKTSTRTRCSFEVAATQEGAHVTYLDAGSSQMGKKESLEDAVSIARFEIINNSASDIVLICLIISDNSFSFPSSHKKPLTPSFIIPSNPPLREAIVIHPIAIASK